MFVRRWSATTWVSSPSPTSPSSTVARAWWARTRSSCRWSESIAQHRKIWLRGEVDKKCKLHLIWFATDWSVKLPAFRRNFQTHVWTHVESQNTNHGVDHRDVSMFLYVFIIFIAWNFGHIAGSGMEDHILRCPLTVKHGVRLAGSERLSLGLLLFVTQSRTRPAGGGGVKMCQIIWNTLQKFPLFVVSVVVILQIWSREFT